MAQNDHDGSEYVGPRPSDDGLDHDASANGVEAGAADDEGSTSPADQWFGDEFAFVPPPPPYAQMGEGSGVPQGGFPPPAAPQYNPAEPPAPQRPAGPEDETVQSGAFDAQPPTWHSAPEPPYEQPPAVPQDPAPPLQEPHVQWDRPEAHGVPEPDAADATIVEPLDGPDTSERSDRVAPPPVYQSPADPAYQDPAPVNEAPAAPVQPDRQEAGAFVDPARSPESEVPDAWPGNEHPGWYAPESAGVESPEHPAWHAQPDKADERPTSLIDPVDDVPEPEPLPPLDQDADPWRGDAPPGVRPAPNGYEGGPGSQHAPGVPVEHAPGVPVEHAPGVPAEHNPGVPAEHNPGADRQQGRPFSPYSVPVSPQGRPGPVQQRPDAPAHYSGPLQPGPHTGGPPPNQREGYAGRGAQPGPPQHGGPVPYGPPQHSGPPQGYGPPQHHQGPPQPGPGYPPPQGPGQPFNPNDPQQRSGRPENADALKAESLVRSRKRAPEKGWRKVVHSATFGMVHPGESAAELRRRELAARARTHVAGGHHRVAVLSLKGGVGKTTTTVALGSTLASLRGDRVLAVDANPDRGTLSDKVRLETNATIRDLLNEKDLVRRYADIRGFTSQAQSRLEILASDRDPAVSEAFSEADYREVSRLLEHYYSICLTDCGTGLLHSAMRGVLGLADQVVLVSTASVDGARSASATLDWLEAHEFGYLVRGAVVVLSMVRTDGRSSIDLNRLEEHFASRSRAVVRVPWDTHLEEGAEVTLENLQPATRDSYLQLAAVVGEAFAWPR